MRLISVVLMAGTMLIVAILAFLHTPMLHVQLKPTPRSERIGSIRDVSADNERPRERPTEAQLLKARVVIGGCAGKHCGRSPGNGSWP